MNGAFMNGDLPELKVTLEEIQQQMTREGLLHLSAAIHAAQNAKLTAGIEARDARIAELEQQKSPAAQPVNGHRREPADA